MTQKERMIQGLVYDTCDKEIMLMQAPYKERLWEFNQFKPSESDKKEAYMKEVFAECGEGNYIESPFHASWGGKNVHFGSKIYANFNLTLIDDGHIYIGDRVLIGPNVVIATANHPLNAELRRKEMQYNMDVHIDENVWIGAGSIILPGVHIGKNSVIGAGSVVTHDVPPSSLAYGNPCRFIREIGAIDREFLHGDMRIDWDEIISLGMLNKKGIFEPKE
ncbi:MAG: sugar O-acetyltransferase [Bacilli bacterium]|nr:sugar O-acetyltransferase [Bacilli bacterium]MBO6284818.1 sugar O-acetyltransferase [Bacilli bacterium]